MVITKDLLTHIFLNLMESILLGMVAEEIKMDTIGLLDVLMM